MKLLISGVRSVECRSVEREGIGAPATLYALTRAHLDTTTGTQPSGCRVVSIAPCCSVNAAFLFAEPRLVVVVSRCTRFSERLSAEQAGGIYSAPAVGGLKSALEFGHLAVRNRVTCGLCPHFV